MNKTISLKIIVIMMSCVLKMSAQDPHFSIYSGVPIGLNPSYTGNYNGNFRVSAQYRDQWNSILSSEAITAYRTAVASAEARTNRGIDENDFVAIGTYFMYDIAGQSRLTNTNFGISTAYRKALDAYGDHFIAVGAKAAVSQKRINTKDLTWGTQWDGTRYDGSIQSGENTYLDDNLVFYDISTGLSWGYNIFGTRNRFSAGLGLLHINEPKESFYASSNTSSSVTAVVPMKINFNLGIGLQLNERIDIMPKLLVMKQGKNFETIFGSDIRFLLDPSDEYGNSFYIGGLLRVVGGDKNLSSSSSFNFESAILTARYDVNNFEIGAAYDFNISDLSSASKYQGGFEIYTNYVFKVTSNRQRKMFCPKF